MGNIEENWKNKKMNEENQRPDPDQLLSLIKKEESRKDQRRGHLKIFLGYVAGVGKTYRMLSEAHILQKQGKDVVVGIAETHGRSETRELLKGLEVIPRQKIDYRGITLDEMDIDQVLKRKPDYVLVDELAHNNVPGSRHLKRYQDVEELLNAGINVYSTLNIQHIESINDIVRQITGVEIRETVPDKIIELADKIELVDLPIDELLERLKEGKVYIPEKAKQAMENFFTEKNLVALREMALRYATVHVDYDMDYYLKKENILGPWETSNRIMVCISPNASSKRLIRIAHRFADRFNAEWFAVYVEPSYKLRVRKGEIQQLENNLKLVDELGGMVFRLTGSISDEIVSLAQSKNITLILMGHSRRTRLQELIEGSIINKVIQKSDAQVLVVENEDKYPEDSTFKKKDSDTTFDWKPYAVSLISIGATLIICLMLQPFIEAINIPMIFIIPVALTGMLAGRKAGILASLLAVVAFDFFFVPPFYTFAVDDVRFIPTFLVLFVVGIITSLLADTVKRQVEYTRQREAFISSLYDFSKDLLISQDLNDILDRSTRYIAESFNYEVLILLPDEENNLKMRSRFGESETYDGHELGVSNWVYENKKEAGCGTDTLASSKWYHIPLKVQNGILGVMAISPDVNMDSREKRLIDAFASVVALALSNSINKN